MKIKNSTECFLVCLCGIFWGIILVFLQQNVWLQILGAGNFFGAGGMLMAAAVWYKRGQ